MTINLLIHKHKRDMNYNKYMGVGGKIEIGESPYEAIKRGLLKRPGLGIKTQSLKGKHLFSF